MSHNQALSDVASMVRNCSFPQNKGNYFERRSGGSLTCCSMGALLVDSVDIEKEELPPIMEVDQLLKKHYPVLWKKIAVREQDSKYLADPEMFDIYEDYPIMFICTLMVTWNDTQDLTFSEIADRLDYIAQNYELV